MHVALLVHGTRGDVQPFTALALALMDRGHSVVLAAPENLVGFVEKCGVRPSRLAIDSQRFLESPEGRAWLASGNVTAFLNRMNAIMHAHRDELHQDQLRACEGADVIVTGILTEDYVSAIAEARDLPMVSLHLAPMRPNTTYENALVTARALPFGWMRRLTGVLAEHAWWRANRADVNAIRRKLGLDDTSEPTPRRLAKRGTPCVHAISRHLLPPPPEWGDDEPVVGPLRLPASARARLGESAPPEDLVAWLEAGPPPIFLSLGSMPIEDPSETVRMVAAVVRRLGTRAVIGAGWSRLDGEGLSDDIHVVGAIDHAWLLPRCRAAVHHGGAGTVSAVIEAGLPAVVCSVFADQPFWGARVERLGVGVHLPFRNFGEATLERALRRVLDPDVKAAAERLGAQVSEEPDAADAIVAIIERAGRRRAVA